MQGARPRTRPCLLEADEIVYDSEAKTVSAVGHVEIADDGRILLADRVDYDQASDKVTASGHVSITDDKGNVAFADHVVLTDHMRDGALHGFGALIGKNGRLAAAQRPAHQRHHRDRAPHRLQPCKICNQPGQRTPLWQVKAERVVYDQTKHKVRFNNATIEVEGVPVAWLPAFSVPDPTVRYATGLLTPEIGNSTKIGYFARLPVYVALSPSQDMTMAPMFSTSGGEVLEMEYRARWNNSGLWFQGSGAYNPDGGLGGHARARRSMVICSARAASMLSDNWRTGFDIQPTSNSAYMRFYDISFLDRLVNDLFLEGHAGRTRFSLTSYYFQGLRSTDVTARIPFVLPQLELSFIPMHESGGRPVPLRPQRRRHRPRQPAQRPARHRRDELEEAFRAAAMASSGPSWPDARGDAYHFDNADASARRAPPTPRWSAAPPMSRWTGAGPLSPRAAPAIPISWSPSPSSSPSPMAAIRPACAIEDSQAFEFDDNNIFSFNQVPGYDLIESGPRANVGAMAEALFPGGEVEALVGQTYRLKPDPLFAAFLGQQRHLLRRGRPLHGQVPASGLHRPHRFRPRQRHGPAA